MRSTPSVQRLPFSTRIRGPRLRRRPRRRRVAAAAATPLFAHLVRLGFFGAVAALVLSATADRTSACACSGSRYVADVSPVRGVEVMAETDNDFPTEAQAESMPNVPVAPAAAAGGGGAGGGGGEQPVAPRPCPTYASPEAMLAAAAAS